MSTETDLTQTDRIQALDRKHLWHPYTRSSMVAAGLPTIGRGTGIYLQDLEGRSYVDAVSSWWACSLGHSHPRLIQAIQQQAETLQHSILGNLSHPPAVELATRLAKLMPDDQRHVLFSSDGASAVEAALKIALQYAHLKGYTTRTRFVSIQDAYHGDTLGAVGVGYLEAFHKLLEPALSVSMRLPFPSDPDEGFRAAEQVLTEQADVVAGVIVEPVCLGAAGMRMYAPVYLQKLAALCRSLDIPLIADEIAMGFGRTGRMFAFEHAGIDPDLVTLGKALTGGYLPMSAVIARNALYERFSDTPVDGTFYHGHTWSGNPIAAAVANEALRIYEEMDVAACAARLGRLMEAGFEQLDGLDRVKEVRCLGLIGAVELQPSEGIPSRARRVQALMTERGYLIRPLDDVLYIMPPMIIQEDQLRDLVDALCACIREVG